MQDPTECTRSRCFLDELLIHILQYLNPCEVVRLRQVSKQFNDVSHDAHLWKVLYTNARLPRPSGPYSWQSTSFLERTLVQSDRLSRIWTSHPITTISSTNYPHIRRNPSPLGSPPHNFLFGRLFIWYDGVEVLTHDIDTDSRQVIWKNSGEIESLSACSMDAPDGRRVIVALHNVGTLQPTKLLVFRLQGDSIQLSDPEVIMDLEQTCLPFSAASPFLCFNRMLRDIYHCERLVIDTRTWAKYKFPAFSTNLADAPASGPYTCLCGRYMIDIRRWDNRQPPKALIQVFAVPYPSQQPSAEELRLLHEIVAENVPPLVYLLRVPVVDPMTGDVNIRFFGTDYVSRDSETQYYSIDLFLSRTDPNSEGAPSMSVDVQMLFRTAGQGRNLCLQASDDGYGRGFITVTPLLPNFGGYDYATTLVYKFSVDSSKERCTAVLGEPHRMSIRSYETEAFSFGDRKSFDSVKGRVHSTSTFGLSTVTDFC